MTTIEHTPSEPILRVEGLEVSLVRRDEPTRIVTDTSFTLHSGEILAMVGESGSGKSVSMLALMGLLPRRTVRITGGTAHFDGRDLVGMRERELRDIRGSRISMIFQDPLTALDPLMTVGAQIVEAIQIHEPTVSRARAWERAVEGLDRVGISDAEEAARRYPHQFSGGMRQRVMIAIAMANDPEVLIADEPTTALDVTIQAQILQLIREMRDRTGMAVILISHDLGVVSEIADSIVTMYAGRTIETGQVAEVLRDPAHHYTRGLIDSIPPIDTAVHRLRTIPGSPPPVGAPPSGCPFHPRCPRGSFEQVCAETVPARTPTDDGFVACHFPLIQIGATR